MIEGQDPSTPADTESKKAIKSILKKGTAQAAQIPTKYEDYFEFNDGKEWLLDFYKLFWDEDLNENLY